MPRTTITWCVTALAVLLATTVPATAQIVEAVGERALGMGGAFVAVANDSSTTWWNPAAQADGPFFDLSIGRAESERDETFPAGRDRVSGFALATPVIGLGIYRLVVAAAKREAPVGQVNGGRQDEGATVALQTWRATSVGGTIVHTLAEGTHVGATLKYVRGSVGTGVAGPDTSPADGLAAAVGVEQGRAEGKFDLDVGALATAGAIRLGVVVRNVRAPEFADGAFRLPRQARVGVAIAADQIGGPPLTISLDADVRAYATASGMRRVVAVGAEQWLVGRRLGVRAGARFNQVGQTERALTAGASLALRSGSYLEGHVVRGGSPAEQGWGTGVRVSF